MSTVTREITPKEQLLKPEAHLIWERCAGCQECIIRCPTQAISMDVATWKAKIDNELCVGCRQCERTCPFSAITVSGPVKVATRVGPLPARLPEKPGSVAEVRPGIASMEDAVKEANRCLNCPDPTCVLGCPAHNDIPGFIKAIRESDLGQAQKILAETTCLPDICSRVCDWSTQCEGACSLSLAGSTPVAVGALERFVTDHSPIPPIRRVSERGKQLSIGILGSGPAGIAAAGELAREGVEVTIYERSSVAGGVLHWGIPSYVLPDAVSGRPIEALHQAGVKIRTNMNVTPESIEHLFTIHDAVIAAFGASVPEIPKLSGIDLTGVTNATVFLTAAKEALASGNVLPEFLGATVPVLVLGGSDTAIDVARSIIRLGGKPIVIHRREEKYSRARTDEIEEAKNEGVEFRFSTNITRLEGEAGELKKAVLLRTQQKSPNAPMQTINDSEETIDTGMVVLATGYKLDPAFAGSLGLPSHQPVIDRLLPDRRWIGSGIFKNNSPVGKIAWEREYGLCASLSPRRQKLWVVGDALIGPSTVVSAMAQGRIAARSILDELARK